MVKVKYTDNTGNNESEQFYDTKELAVQAVEKELEEAKEYFRGRNYDYGDFGNKTEIWDRDGNDYACWEFVEEDQ